MENLAYLHLAFDYEDCPSTELAAFSFLLDRGASPNWQRLSSRAWRYMLPLALTLSLMTAMSSAMALQKGDQGPSVLALQKDLRRAGFYQAPITQVYDVRTEDAVKRFQQAAGLQVSGVAGTTTVEKLDNWKPPAKKTTVATTPAKKPVVQKVANKVTTTNTKTTTPATTKRRAVGILGRGDEGEEVRLLQERLRVAGYYYGNATGIFGPITEESVKRFQTAYNLESDGLVGPATIRRLPPVGVGYGEDVAPTRRATTDRLQLGDRGEAVRILQEQLIKAGYLEGQPNGYFGPFTADAVKRFQAENYLAASGIAGPTTRAKLYTSVNTGNRNEFNTLEIQRRLMAKGFYKGPLNGVMGNDTKRAIRQAQDFYGISLNDVRSGRF